MKRNLLFSAWQKLWLKASNSFSLSRQFHSSWFSSLFPLKETSSPEWQPIRVRKNDKWHL